MGLSSKQVSRSGIDWNQTLLQAQNSELPKPPPMRKQQQQNQQPEPLKCPRCDSTNTKFCYYNNYNKSQPRHFCRACKRHWTKGGTLRNVPIGGGRKNKRVKKSTTAASAATAAATTTTSTSAITVTTSIGNTDGGLNTHVAIQTSQPRQTLSLAVGDQKDIPPSLYQTVIRPPSLLPQQNLMNTRDLESKDFGIGNGIFMSSTLPLSQNQSLLFPFSTSSSFDTNPGSVSTSLRSSNVYNYGEELKSVEEPTINSAMPSTIGTITQPWEMPTTSGAMEMSNYWSWEDLDSLVSTDLNLPWDDSDIKP